MKVKSESEVAQSCPTLHRSLPGSSVYGIFQERVLELGAIAFSNPALLLSGICLSPSLQLKKKKETVIFKIN